MTKKDYVLIANVIKINREYDGVKVKDIDNLAYSLSHSLRLENAKFDEVKFLVACGVK